MDYRDYLGREVWREKRRQVWERSGGQCEHIDGDGCRCRRQAQDVHHLVYPKILGTESIDTLLHLCRWHHELEHEVQPWDEVVEELLSRFT